MSGFKSGHFLKQHYPEYISNGWRHVFFSDYFPNYSQNSLGALTLNIINIRIIIKLYV